MNDRIEAAIDAGADDVVSSEGGHEVYAAPDTFQQVAKALEVTRAVAARIEAAECVSDEHLGNVSIVGTGMENAPGYASRMFRSLSEAGINIEMITTSQIRITCIVAESQVTDAVRALHKSFELDQA